jgi:hypothetical protein
MEILKKLLSEIFWNVLLFSNSFSSFREKKLPNKILIVFIWTPLATGFVFVILISSLFLRDDISVAVEKERKENAKIMDENRDSANQSDKVRKSKTIAEEDKRVDDHRRSDKLAHGREAADLRKQTEDQRRSNKLVPSRVAGQSPQGKLPGDMIILPKLSSEGSKNQISFFEARGDACRKATDLAASFREDIARQYKSPLSVVRLIRVEASSASCKVVVDTSHGPINCHPGSVFNKKGNDTWLLSTLREMQDGSIINPFFCSPHPEVFERR